MADADAGAAVPAAARATLAAWAARGDAACLVAAVDVGATNVRVVLEDVRRGETLELPKFRCGAADALAQRLAAVAAAVEGAGLRARAAGLASAGRKLPDVAAVDITNYAAGAQLLRLDALPEALFPRARTRLLNDLEALAFGLLYEGEADRLGSFFGALDDSDGPARLADGHNLVLAMGTGLGVALIVKLGGHFDVLPLEGGHMAIHAAGPAHPSRPEEAHLFAFLSQKIYDGQRTIEYEDICSGRGLFHVYEWCARDEPDLKASNPEQVARLATEGGEGAQPARQALLLHYKYLIRCAANLGVVTQASQILLAGDNQVSNGAFVREHRAELLSEIETHTKAAWMKDVRLLVQEKPRNFNVVGALYAARLL